MKKITLLQINRDRDENSLCYESFEKTKAHDSKIDESIYDVVYEGILNGCQDLEDVFCAFQHGSSECPQEFGGRSMSVSDIVLDHDENGKYTAWFCDRVGFKEVDFDITKAHKDQFIKIVYVEPGKPARTTEIPANLASYQQAVDGYIETYSPFEEDMRCCIVCNDSGKINDMKPNRTIKNKLGATVDIIFGPFFICGTGDEDLCSLTDEQAEKYTSKFETPDTFSSSFVY